MNGILIINKPKNCTSHDIVYKVKKIFNEKVGHTGTLDPNATGVLPLLIGKGTLISKYLIEHDKIYEAEIELGIKTDTLDVEGKIIEEKQIIKENMTINNINNILKRFIGKQEQKPPMYSAIKVNGKKLYEYARKNIEVEVKPRKIEIYDIKLIEYDKEKKLVLNISCSKGTYIRSLCADIAEKLGTVGYMKNLKRIQVGIFNIDESITLEELEANKEDKEYLNKKIITIEKMFSKKEAIILNENQINKLLNGVKIEMVKPNDIYRIYDNKSNFIGLGEMNLNCLKRDIIII